MNPSSLYRAALLISLGLGVVACAGQPPIERSPGLSRMDLLNGELFGLSVNERPAEVELTAVNEEMKAFLRERVPEDLSDQRKSELILGAILTDGLQLSYSSFKTYSAQETFRTREGNCLSFTNLYVALAREAGLNTRYQEVDMPITWTSRGNIYMYNLHVNALVKLPGREQIIDFDQGAFNADFPRRPISDTAILAQYHNNLSVHWLGEGDLPNAFLHIRAALEIDPETDYFWTTLGTLYRRGGHFPEAEAAYLLAVEINNERVAMSNLARLYAQIDEPELAAWYRDRVDLFRLKNPYYLFDLAEEAYAGSHYVEAEKLLRRAIRMHRDEPEFYRLLGLTYMRMNEFDKAEHRFQQAANLATTDEQRARYNHKLQLLAGH